MWSAAPFDAGPGSSALDALEAIDLSILQTLVAHRTDALTAITLTIGLLGTQSIVIGLVALTGLVIVVARRSWRTGAAVALSVFLAQTIVDLLKEQIQRPRPPLDLTLLPGDGYAFPSTHAAFTSAGVAAYLAAGWIGRRRTSAAGRAAEPRGRRPPAVAVALVALVVFVGASMVYLGYTGPVTCSRGGCSARRSAGSSGAFCATRSGARTGVTRQASSGIWAGIWTGTQCGPRVRKPGGRRACTVAEAEGFEPSMGL